MEQTLAFEAHDLDLGIEELDELVELSWWEWAAGFASGVAIGVLVAT
jgi:hypothetical protein